MMKHWTILLLLPTLLASCTRAPESETDPATRAIQVSIGSGPRLDITTQAATRTSLDDDGTTVKWQTDDQIALWAVNSAAQTILEAAPFSLYHYNATYNSASFRGSIPQMAEDTYAYYAVSPVPTSTEGLQASYEIPAVQDGAFHGEWDIMVADPIVGAEALREHDRKDPSGVSDNSDIVTLQFAHKIHVLKISIPKNDLGEPVSEIVLTFPKPVAGRLTVDASNPEADGVLSASSNTLTLRFAEPKDVGDVVYAMIAPVTLDEGQQISIVASSQSRESETRSFAPLTADRTFAAGHTTPINYNIPAMEAPITQLIFHLAETGINTLGEAINTFTVTAPSGWTFEDGNPSRTFDVTGTGDYTVRFRGYPNPTQELAGFQVTYDSEHALLSEEFTMPAITDGAENRVASFNVPYLFEEDFNGASAQDYTNSTDELSGIGLPGWGASRYEIQPGRAAFYMYVGSSAFNGIDLKRGRMDTPFLPLKDGAAVSIKVSYNIGAPIVSGTLSSQWNITCEFGVQDDTEGAISGDSGMSRVIERYVPNNGGGFTGSLPQTKTDILVTNATNRTRLTWRATDYQKISGSGASVLTAKYFYIYLDDIKVSIAQ